MKIDPIFETDMVSKITSQLTEKLHLNKQQSKMLYDSLNENILMNIMVDGKNYRVPYKYWLEYVSDFANCCGSCNEFTLSAVEKSKKALLENGVHVTDHAWEY